MSGSAPALPLKQLDKNDSGEAVYHLQRKLTDLGYYHGKCSGTYLDGTAAAVKAYQKDHGLNANGKATLKTLESIYAQELATPAPIDLEPVVVAVETPPIPETTAANDTNET